MYIHYISNPAMESLSISHTCNICLNTYRSKSSLTQHIKKCSIKHGHLDETIGYADLVKLVTQLSQKVTGLETTILRLNMRSNKIVKQNLTTVLEQLTTPTSFINWFDTIVIDKQTMIYFIENSLQNSISNTIQSILKPNTKTTNICIENNHTTLPIICANNSSTMIYIYSNETKWTLLLNSDIERLLKRIQNRLLIKLDDIYCPEDNQQHTQTQQIPLQAEVYNKTIIKIMGLTVSCSQIMAKIRKTITTCVPNLMIEI